MKPIEPALLEILQSKLQAGTRGFGGRIEVDHVDLGTGDVTTVEYRPISIDLDKSLQLVADEAHVVLPWTPAGPEGWGDESVFQENSRLRVYQWYGDPADEILSFTGLIDYKADGRDPGTIELNCRDMMALLIDQTFSTTAPQTAGETGAVRTEANGVYLSAEVSDIVTAILDAAGWPTADRDVTPTSYVLDEFVVEDGATWAGTIIDTGRLAELVGYRAYADEDGVFHFGPSLATSSLTEPPTADYIYHSGLDLLSLLDATDQDDLRTRVKVRGPLTTQVLTDEWRELWRTSKFSKPVGLWHDPTDAANLRVVDRGTKRLYKLRQSDRKVLSSVDISTICAHPLGLSGDPADSSVYWILNAPWINGGSGGNRAKKVRKSDNHVLLSFALPDGEISALKVSSSYLYFTRLDTDRFYRRSKTTGAAIASYQHTHNAVVQANPSGMMIDGTTISVFWANGGTTARFLLCDESAPGTVTSVVKTAGTTLHGGEMDTVTHTACYGDSDSLGLVAKFSLVAVSDRTDQVYAEVVDTALEDDLGALAQSQDRIHDTHSGDAAHPFEVRRETLDVTTVTSLTQIHDTATRMLELLGQFRRVLDFGVTGNPALQKTDIIGVVDPVTGLNTLFSIDTYRLSMGSTFLGIVAGVLIPDLVAENGDVTDDGSADEGPSADYIERLTAQNGTPTVGNTRYTFADPAVAGQLIVVVQPKRSASMSPPTGFSSVSGSPARSGTAGGNGYLHVFYKVCTGGEQVIDVPNGSSDTTFGYAYKFAVGATIYSSTGLADQAPSSNPQLTISAPGGGQTVIAGWVSAGNWFDPVAYTMDSPLGLVVDDWSSPPGGSGGGPRFTLGELVDESGGASYTPGITVSGGSPRDWGGIAIVVQP